MIPPPNVIPILSEPIRYSPVFVSFVNDIDGEPTVPSLNLAFEFNIKLFASVMSPVWREILNGVPKNPPVSL